MSQDSHHSPAYYVKIWAILVVLLIISIIGPELGIKIVTLITAFGIAIVKAWMVAAYFMHLNTEKKYIHYMLYAMLLIMVVFIAGIMTDVNRNEGQNWVNTASKHYIEKHSTENSEGASEHH